VFSEEQTFGPEEHLIDLTKRLKWGELLDKLEKDASIKDAVLLSLETDKIPWKSLHTTLTADNHQ